MIAIIDYDAGNLKSVEKALQFLGQECVITRDFHEIKKADKVILPGVGSFGDAMSQLKKFELDKVIHEVAAEQKPFLGICLGLQLLFEGSEESDGVEGLHLLDAFGTGVTLSLNDLFLCIASEALSVCPLLLLCYFPLHPA